MTEKKKTNGLFDKFIEIRSELEELDKLKRVSDQEYNPRPEQNDDGRRNLLKKLHEYATQIGACDTSLEDFSRDQNAINGAETEYTTYRNRTIENIFAKDNVDRFMSEIKPGVLENLVVADMISEPNKRMLEPVLKENERKIFELYAEMRKSEQVVKAVKEKPEALQDKDKKRIAEKARELYVEKRLEAVREHYRKETKNDSYELTDVQKRAIMIVASSSFAAHVANEGLGHKKVAEYSEKAAKLERDAIKREYEESVKEEKMDIYKVAREGMKRLVTHEDGKVYQNARDRLYQMSESALD